ncbi:hypothetical protein Tsubulata_017907 [Turnera subulata]|uniref:Cytochrome P450 n=1 Tax=Turnera subulata TaxID=218843 RepID=A0A9Q0J8I3_9ROSI|nr:hypothetical protein Tsubulata_017907 [Turnera subulata]
MAPMQVSGPNGSDLPISKDRGGRDSAAPEVPRPSFRDILKAGGGASAATVSEETVVDEDMFGGGSETSATVLEWAFSELLKSPRTMNKAQEEVRQVFHEFGDALETSLEKLNYLRLVIKETLRLHPPFPLILPRECREPCQINGYDIPVKAKGANFEYTPFGAGRRICPGITFGMANVELQLAQLLYHFNWELPGGSKAEALDMTKKFGTTVGRKNELFLVPIPYNSLPKKQP